MGRFSVDASLQGGGVVAIVTGANKGIGFACAQRLCEELGNDATVVITARNEELGMAAVAELAAQGHRAVFKPLDITSQPSIDALATWVKTQGGCDILINNAGIAFKLSAPEPFPEQARKTIDTNYLGTKHVIERLLPHMKPGARVIQVSSSAGQVSGRPAAHKFLSVNLTLQDLDQGMENFVSSAASGTVAEAGFWMSAYGVSKMGVTQYTRVAALSAKSDGIDVSFVSCCPGLCRTDMTGGARFKSVVSFVFWAATWLPGLGHSAYEGADTPVFLALLPKAELQTFNGKFVRGRCVQPF